MKKWIAIVMVCFLALSLTPACAENAESLRIVCTTFPQYDWVRQILGDRDADVMLLLDNGIDLHNYQPSAADIVDISTCDLFVYVGGESDEWVEDVLEAAQNPSLKAVSMLACVEAKEEEVVEGMQESEPSHEHDEHDHDDEVEYDEHVWLSLRHARTITGVLAETLCEIDPDHADAYRANATAYAEKLDALDEQYRGAVSGGARKTILFADRFPFRYLADDYGLTYYAAFVGCSAETEASFETVAFLANQVDALALPVVLTIEGDDHSIAQTVVSSTEAKDQRILVMNSMQSVTATDIENGTAYLGVMSENLDVLKAALQ